MMHACAVICMHDSKAQVDVGRRHRWGRLAFVGEVLLHNWYRSPVSVRALPLHLRGSLQLLGKVLSGPLRFSKN